MFTMYRLHDYAKNDIDPTIEKLHGPDFAIAVKEADVTLTTLGFVTGQKLERLNTWLAGIDQNGNPAYAPPWMRSLLKIFAKHPEALQTAIDVSEANEKKHTSKR